MKIMVAIPCFDKMDVDFVQCLCRLEKVDQTDIVFASTSLIYDARNELSMKAIKGGYDWILWLDSDMIFEPTLLKDLLATKKDCVCGQFFNRRPLYKPAIFSVCEIQQGERKGEIKPVAENYVNYPPNKIFEVAAMGMAAVLMKVDKLDAVTACFGLPFSPLAGFGEDLSFCIRWRQLDMKLWCDSRIKVGHIGKIVVDESVWLANKDEVIRRYGSTTDGSKN